MKIPFSFGTRLIFRLLLPGFVLSIVFLPLAQWTFQRTSLPFDALIYIPMAAVVLGWLIMLLDMPIYMLFEGRGWPEPIFSWGLNREERRLARLNQLMESSCTSKSSKFKETALKTTHFPLELNGERVAKCPTRIGNIISEYEIYPYRKYGMDGVFYWYRIWIGLPKDLREELDQHQALVDSAIYVSSALFVSAIILSCYIMVEIITGTDFLPNIPLWGKFVGVFLLVIVGYGIYRLSLLAHVQYGQFFKALFDRYRASIEMQPILDEIAQMTGSEELRCLHGREANKAVWRYLQWHKVRLPGEMTNRNIEDARIDRKQKISDKKTSP